MALPLPHMTDEETVALGTFCEGLMQSTAFNVLHDMFKAQQVNEVFNSSPEQKEQRERAYAELHGVAKLLGMMKSLVLQRDNVVKRNDQPTLTYPDDHPVEGDLGTVPL